MSERERLVGTIRTLRCDAGRAWEKVCFYEHIELQPTWLLRAALPTPMRTTGAYRRVGDVSSCQYSDGGYLTKRILAIGGRRVDFEVIEQTIRYAGRIVLKGGTIRIQALDDGTCTVEMLTRYELRAAWLEPLRFVIEHVVKAMHRIVIRDMRAKLESRHDQAALTSN